MAFSRLRGTCSFAGSSTNLGCGLCQRIGWPSLYQGKIPFEYAARRRVGRRSPPTARSPLRSARSGSGNASLFGSSTKMGTKDLFRDVEPHDPIDGVGDRVQLAAEITRH